MTHGSGRSPGGPTGLAVLALHLLSIILIQSVWFGISSIMAVLARKRFGAGDWQTLLITAAVPTLLVTSIFWNDVLHRMSIRGYLLLHWACTMLPLACAAAAQNFWQLWMCHVLAAIGAAGWSPVSGDLLKRFYPDAVRGRAFGLINSAMFLGMTVTSYTVGHALDVDENLFRLYLPAAAAAYGIGVLILRRLVSATAAEDARVRSLGSAEGFGRLIEPLLHMREILRADRTFYRYEAAFMTYGVGWMICNALLPVLATERLKMTYTEFAASTQVLYPLGMLLMMYPMGWVMDRIGATRTSGISFAALTLYPLGLLTAHSVSGVGAATVFYGLAMAGVQITWMLGPVTLAPTPEKVAQYVAIHATLVGLRGIVAQGLGMLTYRVTGSFTCSFVAAAAAFAWAAWQMWRLHGALRALHPEAASLPATP